MAAPDSVQFDAASPGQQSPTPGSAMPRLQIANGTGVRSNPTVSPRDINSARSAHSAALPPPDVGDDFDDIVYGDQVNPGLGPSDVDPSRRTGGYQQGGARSSSAHAAAAALAEQANSRGHIQTAFTGGFAGRGGPPSAAGGRGRGAAPGAQGGRGRGQFAPVAGTFDYSALNQGYPPQFTQQGVQDDGLGQAGAAAGQAQYQVPVGGLPIHQVQNAPGCLKSYTLKDISYRSVVSFITCFEEIRAGSSVQPYERVYVQVPTGVSSEVALVCHVQYSKKTGKESMGNYGPQTYGLTYVTIHVPMDFYNMFQALGQLGKDDATPRNIEGKEYFPLVVRMRQGMRIGNAGTLADILNAAQTDLTAKTVLSMTRTQAGVKFSMREIYPYKLSAASYSRHVTDTQESRQTSDFLRTIGM